MFVILPLWLLAGLADWACHRATDIAATSGLRESLLHLLMLAEAAVAVMAGLLLDITATVLLVMAGAFVLHEITALVDVNYSSRHREITPVEQHVHSFLELLPLMALAFVAVLHWDQVTALAGPGGADWGLRLKTERLPMAYVVAMIGATAVINVTPFVEELVRCLRGPAPAGPAVATRHGRTARRYPLR